ncbi:MAG: SUF system Fe-S cluster assembly regulator [Gammaproteobacteria bacterium]|jgi:FeS assembly SUF system regulator
MSKLTDYGTLVLSQLATAGQEPCSAGVVAGETRLALPTVSKLLKALTRSGLVVSTRGSQGGYALARPPGDITAAEIIDALEGPVAITACSADDGSCDLESFCRVGLAWQSINLSIREALQQVTLADLQRERNPMPVPDLRSHLEAAAN